MNAFVNVFGYSRKDSWAHFYLGKIVAATQSLTSKLVLGTVRQFGYNVHFTVKITDLDIDFDTL